MAFSIYLMIEHEFDYGLSVDSVPYATGFATAEEAWAVAANPEKFLQSQSISVGTPKKPKHGFKVRERPTDEVGFEYGLCKLKAPGNAPG